MNTPLPAFLQGKIKFDEKRLVGFTGTQRGMSMEQFDEFPILISRLLPDEFHHGDCVGADYEAHELNRLYVPNCSIIIHPPDKEDKRAYCEGASFTHPELPYLTRNRNIVDACQILVATPGEMAMQLRSGTWSTVRYAQQMKKRVIVILPDGKVIEWA